MLYMYYNVIFSREAHPLPSATDASFWLVPSSDKKVGKQIHNHLINVIIEHTFHENEEL